MNKFFLLSIILVFILSACSENTANSNSDKDKEGNAKLAETAIKKEKEIEYYSINISGLGRNLTEVEKNMLRKPGKYSGDNYDEQKVNELLDELPDDLTAEQYLNEMLLLLNEDYHKELKTLLNFDSSVDVNIARPDESVQTPEIRKTHYAILLDASGSMAGKVGSKTKMEQAKEAVKDFVSNIPESSTISLSVYGHKGTGNNRDKALSCSSTETVFNGNYEEQKVAAALGTIKPAGWTPIALALDSVKKDIPQDADDVVVYVVSDGIETCDGNPVEAAKKLTASNIKTVVNIIGFDVDNKGQQLLKEVADAGNGEFIYVGSEQQLKQYMREQYEQIEKRWLEWKEAGKKQADELKEQKKKLADETKESMTEKSDRQKERLLKAQEYIKQKYADDSGHPSGNDTWSLIINYCNDIWSYGVKNGNDAWIESVKNGQEEWSKYVDEGNVKINEATEKKNSQ